MNLLDKISVEEYKMMENYRNWYAYDEDYGDPSKAVSIKELLDCSWNSSKQDLFNLLGGKDLIINKEFSYEKSQDEIINELEDVLNGNLSYGRNDRDGYKFIKNFRDWVSRKYCIPSTYYNDKIGCFEYKTDEDRKLANKNTIIRDGLFTLISFWVLADNKYDGSNFTIELENGKQYTISAGCKPMKALAKIAAAYNIEGFEDFRICHSLVHNQKKITGIVSLSIHPLDYWTMSDNECGWDSCMSWKEEGGYRQGTVEMMNSPMVVVAYISAKEPMWIGESKWNNKRWRQLFIVNKDVILGIKSYPYHNNELTNTVMGWLKNLAETNMGWKYFGNAKNKPIQYNFEPFNNPEHMNTKRIKFNFYSNNMYTDVGCLEYHPMYVGTHIHEKGEMTNTYNRSYYNSDIIVMDFNYSGYAQCMCCGELDPPLDGEAELCCSNCQIVERCSECGYYHRDENFYSVDGAYLCTECYNRMISTCIVCGHEHFKDDMTRIYLRIPTSKEYENKLIANGYKPSSDEQFQLWVELSFPVYVCSDCMDEFEEIYLNKDSKIKVYNSEDAPYWGKYYVDVSDLNFNDDVWLHSGYISWSFCADLKQANALKNYDSLADEYSYRTTIIKAKQINQNNEE